VKSPHPPGPRLLNLSILKPPLQVGDHYERIDDQNLFGLGHFEVGTILREIPKGTTFLLRIVKPKKANFGNQKNFQTFKFYF
jgi:hypothetical protein